MAPLVGAACFGLVSADVPLALAWGRAVVDGGGLPATNLLSWSNPHWPVHLDKWGFQVGAWVVHALAGATGLVALRVALLGTALTLAARAGRVRWRHAPSVLALAVAGVAVWHRPYLRAELVTWMSIPCLMALLPGMAAGRRGSWAGVLALQAVWANCHGYWVCGPLVTGAAAAGLSVQPRLARHGWGRRPAPAAVAWRLALAVPALLGAACLTPYGWRTLAQPWRLAFELESDGLPKAALADFVRPWHLPVTVPAVAAALVALALPMSVAMAARAGRLRGDRLAVAAVGAVLGLAWARNLPLLALAGLPLLVDGCRLAFPGRGRRFAWPAAAIPGGLMLVGLLLGWDRATDFDRRRPGLGWDVRSTPIDATDVLRAGLAPGGRCWNDLHSGGWLAWRLGPGRTYIDGNTDGYPHAFLARYRETLTGARDVLAEAPDATWFFARPDHPAHRTVLGWLASHPEVGVRAWTPHGAVLARGLPGDPGTQDRARAACRAWAAAEPAVGREALRLRGAPDGGAAARLAAVFPYAASARVVLGDSFWCFTVFAIPLPGGCAAEASAAWSACDTNCCPS